MTPSQLADMLRSIGAEQVKQHLNRVTSCCPLAPWTHASGRDSKPSFVAFPSGLGEHSRRPIYTCLACSNKGSIRDLLLFLLSRGRDTWAWLDVLSGESTAEDAKRTSAADGLPQGFLPSRLRQDVRKAMEKVTAEPVAEQRQSEDGRPWYDYKALQESDTQPEVPWSEYEGYAGSVPKYAVERGLTLKTCKTWQLGNDKGVAQPTWNASPRMPRWVTSRRLLFPIRDHSGRLVAISGRLYAKTCFACGGAWARSCERCGGREDEHWDEGDGLLCQDGEAFRPLAMSCVRCERPMPPKYLHRKGFKRNLLLFGEHRDAEDRTDGRVYVVEGHLDMIRLWQMGYRPVVATLGSHPGAAQIEKLVRYWDRVIVVSDGNDAGDKMAQAVKTGIAGRIPVFTAAAPRGHDPGDMTEEAARDLLREPPWPRLTNAKQDGQNR